MNALSVIDSQISELRASGETGNVENLLEAHAAFAELIEQCDALTVTAHGHVDSVLQARIAAVRSALARVRGAE